MKQVCDVTSRCGLARACRNGSCGPCLEDGDCNTGENCGALDHCVRAELTECRSTSHCRDEETCVLSGYTPGGARGNEDLRSYCLPMKGGKDMVPNVQKAYDVPPALRNQLPRFSGEIAGRAKIAEMKCAGWTAAGLCISLAGCVVARHSASRDGGVDRDTDYGLGPAPGRRRYLQSGWSYRLSRMVLHEGNVSASVHRTSNWRLWCSQTWDVYIRVKQ